jgi:serine/threonine protein kinase
MSPEQAEGKQVDGRSDVFSMGCLMYEMLTGRRAFQGETKARTLSAILMLDPPSPSQIADDIPPELERIVQRCLRKEPARRFQHMDDLNVALQELREESGSGKLAGAPRGKERSPRARLAVLSGVVGGLLALIAVVAGLWWFSKRNIASTPLGPPTPVTTYPDIEEQATLSPDGRQVAFSGNVEAHDNFDIYVKLIGSEFPCGSPGMQSRTLILFGRRTAPGSRLRAGTTLRAETARSCSFRPSADRNGSSPKAVAPARGRRTARASL